MQSFIESTWATFGRKDDNKTNITNRLRSNISWRGNSMNGKLKNRLLYVNEVKKTLDYAENAIKNEGGEPYFPNAVRTCKYSVINFLPKSLFEQFRRVANLYFLMISLLQLCTDLSPTNPYSTIGPLTLVLFVTMFKEALEDRNRHKQDYIVNHQKAEVYGPISEMSSHSNKKVGHSNQNKYISTFWKNIQVGHIVKVKEKEQVPADMVILFTSEERGEAMCETSTLDGESNLKVRTALHWNQIEPLQVEDFGTTVAAEISCELPNRHLYSFDGVIKLAYTTDAAKSEAAARQEANSCSPHLSPRGPIPDSDEIPITIDNVMLRGMKLLNTKWAIGVVVGAGPDSKLIQNMKEIPSKFSHLDRIANRCIALIFSVLFAVCCFSSLKHVSYYVKIITDDQAEKKNHLTELPFRNATLDSFNLTDFLNSWITYLILYNNMVPISLYISLEIVKWYQARKIENDPLMVSYLSKNVDST
jgi:phospholipid-transporting ATPase